MRTCALICASSRVCVCARVNSCKITCVRVCVCEFSSGFFMAIRRKKKNHDEFCKDAHGLEYVCIMRRFFPRVSVHVCYNSHVKNMDQAMVIL